jgi:hypothetical protein
MDRDLLLILVASGYSVRLPPSYSEANCDRLGVTYLYQFGINNGLGNQWVSVGIRERSYALVQDCGVKATADRAATLSKVRFAHVACEDHAAPAGVGSAHIRMRRMRPWGS